MTVERTFAIIKPDAVAAGHAMKIIKRGVSAGLTLVSLRYEHLTPEQALAFYAEHNGKPYQEPLVQFMTSGPSQVLVWEGENAVNTWRTLMGATKPEDRVPGTIRAEFGHPTIVRQNAVHGSDSLFSAQREITQFFGAEFVEPSIAFKSDNFGMS